MLLFGLFRRLLLSDNRKRFLDRLSCPRFDAENSTLHKGLCGYAIPTCHDIFSPNKFALWHHHLDFFMKSELVHSLWNLRYRLKLLWTRV